MAHLTQSVHTEVWIPKSVAPLVQFTQQVYTLASTGIDLMGVGELLVNPALAARLRSFDHIVSWYGANRPEFRAAMNAVGVPCDFHPALPPFGYCGHATDFYSKQVGAPVGPEPGIETKSIAERQSVVIHPFSGGRRKNWPLQQFGELASALPLKVEWCAGPEEALPSAQRFDDLDELANWLAGARLYIGNDSGITHLAAAVGVPVLAFFLTTEPEVWAPRGDHVTVLRNPTPDEAIAAANRLLG